MTPAPTLHPYLTNLTPGMVAEALDPTAAFGRYCEEQIGFPWITRRDQIMLRSRVNALFEECPQANYYTLCRVVAWAKAKRIRRARVWQIVDLVRPAWADGMCPELNEPDHDPALDVRIFDAIRSEPDPAWRRRLRNTRGVGLRAAAYAAWLDARA
jgi:hypothetical protein